MQEAIVHSNPQPAAAGQGQAADRTAKPPFVQPKLTFVQPKLTRQGKVNEITQWQAEDILSGSGFLDPGFSP